MEQVCHFVGSLYEEPLLSWLDSWVSPRSRLGISRDSPTSSPQESVVLVHSNKHQFIESSALPSVVLKQLWWQPWSTLQHHCLLWFKALLLLLCKNAKQQKHNSCHTLVSASCQSLAYRWHLLMQGHQGISFLRSVKKQTYESVKMCMHNLSKLLSHDNSPEITAVAIINVMSQLRDKHMMGSHMGQTFINSRSDQSLIFTVLCPLV